MDNSILYLHQIMQRLQEDIKDYSVILPKHAFEIPKEELEKAVSCGFPEDICATYCNAYLLKNLDKVNEIVAYINSEFIPYLENVSFHLKQAMQEGPGGVSTASVLSDTSAPKTPVQSQSPVSEEVLRKRTQALMDKRKAIEKNDMDLEKALGIKKGTPMTIAQADKQSANPHYGENSSYSINCATCAIAYALRLRGFDVTAKGNINFTKNREISRVSLDYFDLWKNADGSRVKPTTYGEWAAKNGIREMEGSDYQSFFLDYCKEKGTYIVTVRWEGGGAHATILQRGDDGRLFYIEPQVHESDYTDPEGRRSINDLIFHGEGLSQYPAWDCGILRVDDKVFNPDYAVLFNTNNN